jgi:hypothetical protein
MDDAALLFGLRIGSGDRIFDPGETVGAEDQDILDAAILQSIQDTEPVCAALILSDLDRQDLLVTSESIPRIT